MSLLERTLRQAGRPVGHFGRFLLRGMNSGHSDLTTWGLGLVDIASDWEVLDIGCGGGATIRRLAGTVTAGKVVGIDYSPDAVAVARKKNRKLIGTGRVEILEEDVATMGFGDGTFDLAIAIESHYFWLDLGACLREVHRVTKPGGRLLIVGALYRDTEGKHVRRNQRIVDASGMPYLSIEELRDVVGSAGYSGCEALEEADKGWFAVKCKK